MLGRTNSKQGPTDKKSNCKITEIPRFARTFTQKLHVEPGDGGMHGTIKGVHCDSCLIA